ncbi:AGAP005303-PA protein [Babesia caballi]|uniref:AGAP005303-PA protein n=1 Tax=Babesia caballi TaxID=5871 RepID=A0AAV4LZJ4_BABCB|nr:AGAP005303-PA protein [Babesia caballi]
MAGRMTTAKAGELVGEEGLEGGGICVFTAASVLAISLVLIDVVTVAVIATPNWTDMGGYNFLFEALINTLPIITHKPSTSVHVKLRALLVQKPKLELQSISVVGESVEQRGTG